MNAREMRRNAEHCLDAASVAADETQRERFLSAAKAWRSLGHCKDQADCALLPEQMVADARSHAA
jgi:hypothetical protein